MTKASGLPAYENYLQLNCFVFLKVVLQENLRVEQFLILLCYR